MLKLYKVLILVVFVAAAMLSIGYGVGNGVTVSGGVGLLRSGGTITDVDGNNVRSVQDWYDFIAADGAHFVTYNGNSYELESALLRNVTVKDLKRSNLDMGIDLQGGTRVMLKPAEKVTAETVNTAIIPVLQSRINAYGLQEITLRSECDIENCFVIVEIGGESKDIIERLLASRGNFEARIPLEVKLYRGTGTFSLGGATHNVKLSGSDVLVDNNVVMQGGTINIEGVDEQVLNATNDSVFLSAIVLKGSDIENVFTDSTRSVIQRTTDGYEFSFSILISKEGAERFAKVTSGIGLDVTRRTYLASPIILYLDGKPVTELNIASDLAGRVLTEISIQGFRQDRQSAVSERSTLQSILKAGALPVSMNVVNVESVSPKLGSGILDAAFKSAIFAIIAVSAVVLVRYRSIKIALPMVITSVCETIILLGIAAGGNDLPWVAAFIINTSLMVLAYRSKVHIDISDIIGVVLTPAMALFLSWTMDLSTIAGFIAFLGTGIGQMIIISDEMKRVHLVEISFWEKIRRAFSMIFASAITVVSTMFALLFIGVGIVKGFAITTMIGVLVGVLVTRPAYSQIVEYFLSKKEVILK
ncbi:MAG: MMPL family transporter [Candidatus Aenigmatarchaeota archaeon]